MIARLQNLRNLLRSERNLGVEQQRAVRALDQEMNDQLAAFDTIDRPIRNRPMLGRPIRAEDETPAQFAQRTGFYRAQGVGQNNSTASESPLLNGSVPAPGRHRRRAFRPSDRLQRYQRERLSHSGRGAAPADAYITPSQLSAAFQSSERTDRPSAKRRKLDDGTYDDEPKTFSYGHNGQVVPGQLRMEIISCDGGEYSDPHVALNSYPQNVLRDDTSVYCTKSNTCNLLLKHVGGMPFTLTKLVVKAPRSGYDSPIQEGLIFVAMEDEDLIDRTLQYDDTFAPARLSRREQRRLGRDSLPPSQEYMNSTRSPLRSIDRSRYLNNPTDSDDPLRQRPSLVPDFDVTIADLSGEEDIGGDGPPSPRPWHDDDYSFRSYVDRYRPVYPVDERNDGLGSNSSDSEGYEPTGPAADDRLTGDRERFQRQQVEVENTLARRNRMLNLIRAQRIRDHDEFLGRQDSDARHADEETPQLHGSTLGTTGSGRTFGPAIGSPDPAQPSDPRSDRFSPSEIPCKYHTTAGQANSSNSKTDTFKPHARFFISRNKSSAAIKFDPPV